MIAVWIILGVVGLVGLGAAVRSAAKTGGASSTGAAQPDEAPSSGSRVGLWRGVGATAVKAPTKTVTTAPTAGQVVGRPDKGSGSAGAVAGRTEEPSSPAPSAGAVAGRTDEPSSPTVVGRPADTASQRSYIGAVVKEVTSRIVNPTETLLERAAKANTVAIGINNVSRSDCPGGVGAVLSYGSLLQVFFADWMRKHKHMSFDWHIDFNEGSGIYFLSEYSEADWEIETSPESQPRLWFHVWDVPAPPCKNLNSDIFNKWPSDSRGPLYYQPGVFGRMSGREFWQDWGLWRLEDAAAILWASEQPGFGWSGVTEAYEYELGHDWQDELGVRTAGGVSSYMGAWKKASPWSAEYEGRFRWLNPSTVHNFDRIPIQLMVHNWNRDVMARGRWKDRFLLLDTSELVDRYPHTFDFGSGDLANRLRDMKELEEYLHNGRWLVWATLAYWIAYHKGNTSTIPRWFVEHCSAWGVPVPRPGRKCRKVADELLIDPAAVPDHFHGTGKLDNLLRAMEAHTPIPGSLPVRKMLKPRLLLNWRERYTGSYRPPIHWPSGWLEYQQAKQPAGTDWASTIIKFAYSVYASCLGAGAVEGAVGELTAASEKLIAQLPDFAVEALTTITAKLISAAGNATKSFLLEGVTPQSWEPIRYLEILGQTGADLMGTARDFGFSVGKGTNLITENDVYEEFRGKFDKKINEIDDEWGFVADIFGDTTDGGLIESNPTTRDLYKNGRKAGLY